MRPVGGLISSELLIVSGWWAMMMPCATAKLVGRMVVAIRTDKIIRGA